MDIRDEVLGPLGRIEPCPEVDDLGGDRFRRWVEPAHPAILVFRLAGRSDAADDLDFANPRFPGGAYKISTLPSRQAWSNAS